MPSKARISEKKTTKHFMGCYNPTTVTCKLISGGGVDFSKEKQRFIND